MKQTAIVAGALGVLVAGTIYFWPAGSSGEGHALSGEEAVGNPSVGDQEAAILTDHSRDQSQALEVAQAEQPAGVQPTRKTVQKLADDQTVKGRVVNDLSEPVSGFTILASYRSKEKGAEWEEVDFGPFPTDEFALSDLAKGRWRITVRAPGHLPSKRRSFRIPYKKSEFEITVSRAAVILGVVQDPAGQPAAGATIVHRRKGSTDRVETQADGAFRMEVPPRSYALIAQHPDFAASSEQTIQARPGAEYEVLFTLAKPGVLEGEVLDREDRPRGGWWVELHTTNWRLDKRSVPADDLGKFRMEGLSPGTY